MRFIFYLINCTTFSNRLRYSDLRNTEISYLHLWGFERSSAHRNCGGEQILWAISANLPESAGRGLALARSSFDRSRTEFAFSYHVSEFIIVCQSKLSSETWTSRTELLLRFWVFWRKLQNATAVSRWVSCKRYFRMRWIDKGMLNT